jgi:hypothetical protein
LCRTVDIVVLTKGKTMNFYSIYELPTYVQQCNGLKEGGCITENDDRDEVISDAEDFMCQRALDEGFYGDGEKEVILETFNTETEQYEREIITLNWFAENYRNPSKVIGRTV